jgi:hypothetical protein
MSETWPLLLLVSLKYFTEKKASQNSLSVFLMKVIVEHKNHPILLSLQKLWTILKQIWRLYFGSHLFLSDFNLFENNQFLADLNISLI